MTSVALPLLDVEDAMARVIAWLRDPNRDPHAVRREAIPEEFNISAILSRVLDVHQREQEAHGRRPGPGMYYLDTLTNSQPFHTAVWELVRKGVLRPVAAQGQGGVQPPPFGWRFAVTPYGKAWLANTSGFEALPTEYSRFGQLLQGHAARFGPGYDSRSQEAVACYRAHTYLACCVMCGAAAESILLAIAIARSGDEARILRDYERGGGRGRLERYVASQQPEPIQRLLANFTDLLHHWRDVSAHGTAATADEEEAFTALILLMRFARFAEDRWEDLTERGRRPPAT